MSKRKKSTKITLTFGSSAREQNAAFTLLHVISGKEPPPAC